MPETDELITLMLVANETDTTKTIECLKEIWWHPEIGVIRNSQKLELHTHGWSDNEEIINVLQQTMFWMFYWQMSKRGGHHYFDVPCGESA